MKSKIFLYFCMLVFGLTTAAGQAKLKRQDVMVSWLMADVMKAPKTVVEGAPVIINSEYGQAVRFNGLSDGLFLNTMPLKGLKQFTVELIFRPESGGKFEQRFFHCGEITNSRVMIELRSVPQGWYFDAFINSNGIRKTLIDSTIIHPSDKWYHAAFVIDNGKLTTYINSQRELQDSILFTPFYKGKTSFGVRQNKVSWYKGDIYKIKLTSRALTPEFFTLK